MNCRRCGTQTTTREVRRQVARLSRAGLSSEETGRLTPMCPACTGRLLTALVKEAVSDVQTAASLLTSWETIGQAGR